jgi:uncharacterized protein
MKALFILYVREQETSTRFYATVLGQEPTLYVSGMTEFTLLDNSKLGLMPVSGIKRLLSDLPDPEKAAGVPRSEVYLTVPNAAEYHRRALAAGATELSGLSKRSWGDVVAYSLDPDGHVLAFAEDVQPA